MLLIARCEIWTASRGELAGHEVDLDQALVPQERAYVSASGAQQSTTRLSRALLRLLLARYLQRAPAEVEIDRSCPVCGREHGKPTLTGQSRVDARLQFSVSHGGELLVFAFADDTPVGVDVEPVGSDDVSEELLDFVLTHAERARLTGLPGPQRRRGFLRHWTGKEAVLKALGIGLEVEPKAVELPSPVMGRPAPLTLTGSPPVQLWVVDVDVGPLHVCSLATGREVQEVVSHHLSATAVLDLLRHQPREQRRHQAERDSAATSENSSTSSP